MTKEEWRPIEGYEGLYEVSNLGQVRSVDRVVRGQPGQKINLKGKLKKQFKNTRGYYCVSLWKEGEEENCRVHRLVAVAFLGQQPEGHIVCHGPKGQHCNEVTNLSWGTIAQNMGPDKVRDGTDNRGEKQGRAKLNSRQVRVIRRLLESKSMTHAEIADIFDVARVTITDIKSGKIWGHLESNEEFLVPL